MGRKRIHGDLAEAIVARFFQITAPVFDVAMGQRLERVRKVMKLTQRQLAERLGLSQADISRMENGKTHTAPLTCAAFKSVLGEHMEYFLTRGGYYRYEEISWEYDKQTKKEWGRLKKSRNV